MFDWKPLLVLILTCGSASCVDDRVKKPEPLRSIELRFEFDGTTDDCDENGSCSLAFVEPGRIEGELSVDLTIDCQSTRAALVYEHFPSGVEETPESVEQVVTLRPDEDCATHSGRFSIASPGPGEGVLTAKVLGVEESRVVEIIGSSRQEVRIDSDDLVAAGTIQTVRATLSNFQNGTDERIGVKVATLPTTDVLPAEGTFDDRGEFEFSFIAPETAQLRIELTTTIGIRGSVTLERTE